MTVDTKVIERVITIDARPETVFRLLTDSSEYVKWKGQLALLEPRAGGAFRVEFPNGTDIVSGHFVEVVPPRRVVFTWGWEGNAFVPPGASTVEIDLEPAGNGTRLRLVHRGLPEAAIARHAEGWDFFLPRLTSVSEGGGPGDESAHHTSAERKKARGDMTWRTFRSHTSRSPRRGTARSSRTSTARCSRGSSPTRR